MDQHRSTTVQRTFRRAPSRRDVLRGLAAAGVGLATARLPLLGKAQNQHGCRQVGNRCKRADQCCSGICGGKRGNKKCRAHDQGICTPERDICSTGVNAYCNSSNSHCACVLTTGKAGFCGDFTATGPELCRSCSKDTDCQQEFGPAAACVDMGGACQDICAATGGTACVPSCL